MAPNMPFLKKIVKDKYLILLDQALLSVVNFGSIIVLYSLAKVSVFGDFVITYSYGYFVFILSTYLFAAPILVFLSKKWQHVKSAYLVGCATFNLLTNLVLAIGLFFFLSRQVSDIYLPLFFLLTFGMSFFDLLKKFVFSSHTIKVKYAVISTLALNISFFSLLFYYNQHLTLNTILLVYGISFCLGCLLLLFFIIRKATISNAQLVSRIAQIKLYKTIFSTHFNYAKWIILGGVAFWSYSQGIYILAKAYNISDFTIGKVRTIQNLLGVFNILLIALENHYTPIFSKKVILGNSLNLTKEVRAIFKENYLKFSLLFALAIPIGLLFYNIMYSDKYGEGVIIFFVFFTVQVLLLLIRPVGIALKALEKTKPFFTSHILAAIVMISSFSLLVLCKIDYSIVLSIVVANIIYSLYIGWYYRKEIKTQI